MRTRNTTDEVADAPAGKADPEFVDLVGLRERYGIKRGLAYRLAGEGLIKAVSLRRRGTTRGKKLFEVQSVREFLKGC